MAIPLTENVISTNINSNGVLANVWGGRKRCTGVDEVLGETRKLRPAVAGGRGFDTNFNFEHMLHLHMRSNSGNCSYSFLVKFSLFSCFLKICGA